MIASGLPYLSVVIPAFNEERRIGETLATVQRFFEGKGWRSEVLVVDDGSTDRTAPIVRQFAGRHPGFKLLGVPHAGKGAAVRAGMLAAEGELCYMCDADLSTPIEQVEDFVAAIDAGADIAIGSREAAGARRVGEPSRRHLLGRGFNRIVQFLVVPGIEDTQCGFKMFHSRVVPRLFGRQTLPGWGFDVEILYMAQKHGLAVREVPVLWNYREGSKVRAVRDSFRMLGEICQVRWNQWRGRYEIVPDTASNEDSNRDSNRDSNTRPGAVAGRATQPSAGELSTTAPDANLARPGVERSSGMESTGQS